MGLRDNREWLGYSSVGKCLRSMRETLDSISAHSTHTHTHTHTHTQRQRERERDRDREREDGELGLNSARWKGREELHS
jgi:hypothetical protein